MNNNIMISILKGIQKDYPLINAEWQAIEQAKENVKSLLSVNPQEPKTDILDKIRAEIEQNTERYCLSRENFCIRQIEWSERLIKESDVLKIIDKYRQEG